MIEIRRKYVNNEYFYYKGDKVLLMEGANIKTFPNHKPYNKLVISTCVPVFQDNIIEYILICNTTFEVLNDFEYSYPIEIVNKYYIDEMNNLRDIQVKLFNIFNNYDIDKFYYYIDNYYKYIDHVLKIV